YGDNRRETNPLINNITFHGKFNYSDLKEIFNKTDVLIVPSMCRETFGFVGLEALSHGVPIMVSENVGIKDILVDNVTGIVFRANNNDLNIKLKQFIDSREKLKKINENILSMDFNFNMSLHTKKIMNLYFEVNSK
ncbi:glycosyltransferase, partial [Gottfriedia acidiceleris]|uniref:glycosyltransferase n=1 Tax=Gottfriedia acidiceleris TaxID=371036 RepID=UPI0033921993